MGDTGLEPIDLTILHGNDLRDSQIQGGAKSDALLDVSELASEIDPALAAVVEAWPTLPPSARLVIESIVDAAEVAPSSRDAVTGN